MKWVKNPNTQNPDTMLSLALWGFGFSLGVATCSLIYLILHDRDLSGLNSVSILIGTILAPTIGAYTARKWTDIRYGNGHSVEECPPPADPKEEGKEGA
jgi:hypothetical protein